MADVMSGFGGADFDQEIAASPQPGYRALHESAPVMRMDGMVIVAKHEHVMSTLRNPEQFSSNMDAISIGNIRPLIPLQVDPPGHVKFRRLLDPLFAPKEVAKLEPEVRRLVNELIDGFVARGECELSDEFAIPLPCTVFLALMGLPLEDLDLFLRFKDDIIRPVGDTPDDAKAVQSATGQEIYAYFQKIVDARRAEPRDDLISGFVAAEVEGQRLTDEDILDISYLFLLAGLDTVTASLTCAVAYLANHPDRRDAIANDLSLVPAAVEELLRWETPVPGVPRVAMSDCVIGEEEIKAGDSVMCLLGAANVDSSEFPDADVVDLERQGNRHLAFGGGVHRCLGSHLARLEMRVALEELHRRIPDYAIKSGETPKYTMGIRAVEYLPLVFTPAAS
ncbi:MAG TPA: cytochrome P450 [Acidimicrobiia bacterium]|jgi:cytochrome P450|nr:cytochrome P450 [Acidimicrobiia bacterium]